MDNELIYMPTFRVRQQETIVVKSFEFGTNMYPLLEIVKEHDRVRRSEAQRSFEDIYNELIRDIKARYVFVDLPNYLKQSGAVKDEVLSFSLGVINNLEKRCEYLNRLSPSAPKAIPVISSYVLKTGEAGTIERQVALLQPNFERIAYRFFPLSFGNDFAVVRQLIRPLDYMIIDLDYITPYYKSPPLKPIVKALNEFGTCCKILLRSAINTEIQNVKLNHDQVVFEADNSHIDVDVMNSFGVNATGDFVGIKKDDLTAGGTISPGFIYYDAVENQYYGYRADFKDLSQFENKIVPDVLDSEATRRMRSAEPPFIGDDNPGYLTLLDIRAGNQSGKSQAKFKRLAMEHYLHCMQRKISSRQLYQVNI